MAGGEGVVPSSFTDRGLTSRTSFIFKVTSIISILSKMAVVGLEVTWLSPQETDLLSLVSYRLLCTELFLKLFIGQGSFNDETESRSGG